jgi:hypothetical protein
MDKKRLGAIFFTAAAILALASVYLTFAYAGLEPFFYYHRGDAVTHIGVSSSVIALWLAWSLGVVGLVVARVFHPLWLAGIAVALVCVFYLTGSPSGYLDDLENFMLSPEQQSRIELPKHKS